MGKTNTFTVDGDATPDAVVAEVLCSGVLVKENGAPSTDYDVYEPYSTSTPVRMAGGEPYTFRAGDGNAFQANQIVGYLKTVAAGPFTFMKCHL